MAWDIGADESSQLFRIVDNATDENDGDMSAGDVSLREAVAAAAPGTVIRCLVGSICLSQGTLPINKDLTIEGLAGRTSISGDCGSAESFSLFKRSYCGTSQQEGLILPRSTADSR
jgi:hypothetical protein